MPLRLRQLRNKGFLGPGLSVGGPSGTVKLSAEEPDALRHARPGPWEPWRVTARATQPELRAAGLTTTDLRWLFRKGYVHHAVERTKSNDQQRVLGPRARAVITEKCAFVLTAAGAKAAHRQPQVPFYDRELRELWLGKVLVIRFRRPAPLQHIIWRIDGPLPQRPGHDPKERLRDSIKRLNQNQQKRLIRFCGGARGLGIVWELRSHRYATHKPLNLRAPPRILTFHEAEGSSSGLRAGIVDSISYSFSFPHLLTSSC